MIQETLSLLEHQLTKTGVHLKAELDPKLPSVHGNAGKLQQVFLNLFLNARDAMTAGGTLEVRTWAEDSGARVEVADTGPESPRSTCAAFTILSSPPNRRARAPDSGCR